VLVNVHYILNYIIKMKMKYFLINLLFILIKTQDDEETLEEEQPRVITKAEPVWKGVIEKLFYIFELMEHYIIRFHNYIKQDLALNYPNDLIIFILLGVILYYLLSKFTSKVSICLYLE
jgi:hypothetical protein